ncbi:AAA-like domain protein [compost metagenome]
MYSMVRKITKFLKAGMYDYCNLESVDESKDNNVLVTKNGSLCSFMEINGGYTMVGESKFKNNLEFIMANLSGALSKPGFKLQFVFTRDPESSGRAIAGSISSIKRTVHNLELDIEDMINERERVLSAKTCSERCYLVLTTMPTVLPPSSAGNAKKERIEKVKDLKVGIKPGEFGQSPFYAITAIREIHDGMINTIVNALSGICELEILDAHSAVRALKMEINPKMTSDSWRPSLLGDKITGRLIKESKLIHDVSHIMNPDISFQLFNQAPTICENDSSMVQMGGTFIAPLLVDIPPQDVLPFKKLFESVPSNIPWRISIEIETGDDKVMSKILNKHTFASFLAFSSGKNKLIRDAASNLIELSNGGEIMAAVSICLCTWGDNYGETKKRKEIFAQAAQNWGHMDVIEESGDAIEAWTNTLPGMSDKTIANVFPMPLYSALSMTPLFRPASPWKAGSILFRTMDNKIYPIQPGSSLQTSFSDLVFAPPGFGKSFYLSASNMGLITAPGNKILPRIAIIDIGFSSASFVNLIREALPESKKHLAKSFKLEMTRDNAINPFDTPLGCRRPLAVDREFLVNFMSLVLTPAGSRESIPRLAELTGSLVDAMFDYFSDEQNPNIYEPYTDEKVDAALDAHSIFISTGASWWSVVDALFKAGLHTEAGLAQRHAVPTLNDATTVLTQNRSIRDIFGEAKFLGEGLIGFINSMIVSATKEYSILSQPSAFDIGSARIVSMDLSSVAKGGSDQADKKTGIMYMLARQVMCREFYRGESTLNEIPTLYRGYHAKKIEEDASAPKKICMDEFHRTKPCQPVRTQTVTDIREGRKFNVQIALLSQMVDDFDASMIDLATNIFILSNGGSEDAMKKIIDIFNPSPDAITALKHQVTGPSKEGSSMLYRGSLKGKSNAEMIIRLTLGPVEVWAYSTTHEDVMLRNKITKKIGLNNALRILANEFPGGSAKSYIESRNFDSNKDDDDSIYDVIVAELIIKHKELISI